MKISENLQKARDESVKNSENFVKYNEKIGIVALGAIVLSISYLGSIESSKVLEYDWALVTSWALLLVSTIFSSVQYKRYAQYLQVSVGEYLGWPVEADKKKLQDSYIRASARAEYALIAGLLFLMFFAVKVSTDVLDF